jgi:NAD(P)-dependent dehydrogenase (short-subunit alcohol dehydrogenase family)
MESKRFAAKAAVVIDGASDMGEALATLVVADGAGVAMADLHEAPGNRMVEELVPIMPLWFPAMW